MMNQRIIKHAAVMYIGPLAQWRGRVGRVTALQGRKVLVWFNGEGLPDEHTLRADRRNLIRVNIF